MSANQKETSVKVIINDHDKIQFKKCEEDALKRCRLEDERTKRTERTHPCIYYCQDPELYKYRLEHT